MNEAKAMHQLYAFGKKIEFNIMFISILLL